MRNLLHISFIVCIFVKSNVFALSNPVVQPSQQSANSLASPSTDNGHPEVLARAYEAHIKSITGSSFWQAGLTDFFDTKPTTLSSNPGGGHVSEANGAPPVSVSPIIGHPTTTWGGDSPGQSQSTPSKHVTSTGPKPGMTSLSPDHPSPTSAPISIVVVSNTTGSYTPTQIATFATLTTTLTTSTKDASGTVVGVIIFPNSGGLGWTFPCSLGSCGAPFPPAPHDPPAAVSMSSIFLVISAGSTGSYTPTKISAHASLTSTLLSTTTDSAGSTVGIIVFPSSDSGWVFPCSLGFCGTPFPPPPSVPPKFPLQTPSTSSSNPFVSTISSSGSSEAFTPTQVPLKASLTAPYISSSTDTAGIAYCVKIFPSSGGSGWVFPKGSSACESHFPPAPSNPPPGSWISAIAESKRSSTATDLVASTMTTLPPGFSTQGLTNDLWTDNTWITTESDGSTTIVPVLVGCRNCGGKHGGIILWNLPNIPNVQFSLPGFPKLPKFHFPCVKIWPFPPVGDCKPKTDKDTPGGDSDSGSDSGSTGPDGDKPDSSTDPEKSTPSQSHSSTSQSSSSSNSCTASRTVSDCSVLCVTASATAGTQQRTQSCQTTCFSTASGCRVTGMTTTSTVTSTSTRELCGIKCSSCVARYVAPKPTQTCHNCAPKSGSPTTAATQPSSLSIRSPVNHKRMLPVLGKGTNPLGDIAKMFDYLKQAYDKTTAQNGWLYIDLLGDDDEGKSTSWGTKFSGNSFNRGISGIHGCTAVVVVSSNGVYMSHHFEDPAFESSNPGKFKHDVLDFLQTGDADSPSLSSFVGADNAFQEQDSGKTFIYMFSPWVDQGGAFFKYSDRLGEIAAELQRIVPFVPPANIVAVGYHAKDKSESEDMLATSGKILFEYDPSPNPGCFIDGRLWLQSIVGYDNVGLDYIRAILNPHGNPGRNRNPEAASQNVCPISFTKSGTLGPTNTPNPKSQSSLTANPTKTTSKPHHTYAGDYTKDLYCSPTSDPKERSAALPHLQLQIPKFCNSLLEMSGYACDGKKHDGFLLSRNCTPGSIKKEDSIATGEQNPNTPHLNTWLVITLTEGMEYVINQSTCINSFFAIMNYCPQGQNDNKWGGSIPIPDGLGVVANYTISVQRENSPLQDLTIERLKSQLQKRVELSIAALNLPHSSATILFMIILALSALPFLSAILV